MKLKSFLNLEKVEIESTFLKLQKVQSSCDLKKMAKSLSDGIEFKDFLDEESR